MALPVLPTTFRIVFSGGWNGTRDAWANVLFFQEIGAPLTPVDVANSTEDPWTTFWGTFNTSDVSWDGLQVTKLDGTTPTFDRVEIGTGGSTGVSVPHQCSMVITHQTETRGRSFRGRTFLAGHGQDKISSGDSSLWDGAHVSAVDNAWAIFISAMHDNGLGHVVVSEKLGVATDVVSYITRAPIFTIRRRVGKT